VSAWRDLRQIAKGEDARHFESRVAFFRKAMQVVRFLHHMQAKLFPVDPHIDRRERRVLAGTCNVCGVKRLLPYENMRIEGKPVATLRPCADMACKGMTIVDTDAEPELIV
jgi:hypothetical protein